MYKHVAVVHEHFGTNVCVQVAEISESEYCLFLNCCIFISSTSTICFLYILKIHFTNQGRPRHTCSHAHVALLVLYIFFSRFPFQRLLVTS